MSSKGDSRTTSDDVAVYRKSDRGLDHLVATHTRALSGRERQLLILLDGRRTVGELSQLFGPETIWSLTTGLEEKGFVERVESPQPRKRENRGPRLDADAAAAGAPAPELRWSRDWFALVNLGMLAIVAAMAGSLVVLGLRHSDTKPFFSAAPAGQRSGEAGDVPGTTYDVEPGKPEADAAARVAPLSGVLSGADGSRSRVVAGQRSRGDRVNAP